MLLKEIIVVSATLSAISTILPRLNAQNIGPADELCMQCICEMATGCNLTVGCNAERLCGPFQMTKPYWIDAGKPVLRLDDPESPGAFGRCANDPVCASQAVREYVRRYGNDCNNDGVIDCVDYAQMHQYGYIDCKYPLFHSRLLAFKKCFNVQ